MLSLTPILFVNKKSQTFKANCSKNCSSFCSIVYGWQQFFRNPVVCQLSYPLRFYHGSIIVSDMKYNTTHDFYSRFVVCNKHIYIWSKSRIKPFSIRDSVQWFVVYAFAMSRPLLRCYCKQEIDGSFLPSFHKNDILNVQNKANKVLFFFYKRCWTSTPPLWFFTTLFCYQVI